MAQDGLPRHIFSTTALESGASQDALTERLVWHDPSGSPNEANFTVEIVPCEHDTSADSFSLTSSHMDGFAPRQCHSPMRGPRGVMMDADVELRLAQIETPR